MLEVFAKKTVISQNVAQKLLKKQSKAAFCNKSCSKVARKRKNLFWSDAKVYKLFKKSKVSKHFCAILQRDQRCQKNCSQLKPTELIKL